MADKFTKEKRSSIMSHIGGKETKPEVMVRKFIFSKGLRYRKNDKSLCLSIELLYSYTDVFGMVIKVAENQSYRILEEVFGRGK